MQKRSFASAPRSGVFGGALVRRRALLGAVVLVVLVALAGVLSCFTRSPRPASNTPAASGSSPALTAPSASPSPLAGDGTTLPTPPDTRDPIVFGKAAAVALWSYDTRAYSQPELLAALHRWLTPEQGLADTASVDHLVPSPVLWGRMADAGQYATATAAEAHFPDAFTRALQADPGAITQAYVYAVTVSGRQSIAWSGVREGGAEDRAATFAVQCRPDRSCSLVGVMPSVAP